MNTHSNTLSPADLNARRLAAYTTAVHGAADKAEAALQRGDDDAAGQWLRISQRARRQVESLLGL